MVVVVFWYLNGVIRCHILLRAWPLLDIVNGAFKGATSSSRLLVWFGRRRARSTAASLPGLLQQFGTCSGAIHSQALSDVV
jgi:hypothetical protein